MSAKSLCVSMLVCASSSWAAEPKVIKGQVNAEVTTQEQYEDGPSQHACGDATRVSASSTLKPEGKITYEAAHLIDGKLKSAWSEGADDVGVGTTITFTVGPPDTSRAAFEGAFHVFNGYAASAAVWKKNARVKKLKVSLNGKEVATVELEDTMALQTINLAELFPKQLKEGDALQFVLVEVYPGAKYKDTVLSELVPLCVS
jgi:hypothetical protein